MTFHWPYALIALPFVLAGLLALFAGSQRARARLLGSFASARLLPILLVAYSPVLRLIKQALIAVGVLLAVLALARPQWGYDWQEKSSRGVDVIFVIDTSRSMLTPDVAPNRLERAKLAIYDCVEKMAGNRVGLVAFAGDAFLQCPLTLDYDAFRQTLDAVDTKTIARGGTDIAVGLDAAATALEKSGNNRTIVLLTDGEDLEGQGIEEAKTFAEQGITIYTIGVGTAAGDLIPIRNDNGRTDFVRDQRGELVKSHLDASTLTQIAEATHGFYQPLGATGEGLQRVYEDGIKKQPEQNVQAQMSRQPIERYQWPLAAGTVLLALEMLLGTRRPAWRRRSTPMVNLEEEPISVTAKPAQPPGPQNAAASIKAPPILAGLLLLALANLPQARADDSPAASTDKPAQTTPPSTIESASPKTAQNLFEKGDFQNAANVYDKAAAASPQDGRFRYDEGESLYRNQDYEAAEQAFTKSLSSADLALQQQAYYNLGNTLYRIGEGQLKEDPKKAQEPWETALKNYQNALDLNPTDADARYNQGFVKKQLEQLKMQLEQQKQQQKQDQDKQDKNDQKQDQQNQQNQQNQDNQQQQNQNNQQQSQSQNSQSQQNQQNQDNSQQNQSPNPQNQQNQSQNSQNQQGQQNQNNQSQSSSQNQSGNSQNQPSQGDPKKTQSGQNGRQSPDQKNGGQPQDKQDSSGQKNQPNPKNPPNNGQKQPQSQTGQNGDKKSPDGQKQNANQAKPSSSAGTNSGKEPNAQKSGQQGTGASTAAGQPGSTNSGDDTGNGTVMVGVMSHEEAQQLLNSLKPNERKLPASRLQAPSQHSASDDTYKDW